jgi:Cu(I)/Ag(I) efflux system periplasmic protein CusF
VILSTRIRPLVCGLIATSALLLSPGVYSQSEMAQGEVRRVNLETGKVTIRHGEIKSLDMPPMTMVFTAKPISILQGIEVGDKIEFVAIEENSQYVTTKIVKKK